MEYKREPGIRCVRKGDWKLIKHDVLKGRVQETQLFNLAENPDEFLAVHQEDAVKNLSGANLKSSQVNLALDPAYKETLSKMEALLKSEMQRLNDPYQLWNQKSDK